MEEISNIYKIAKQFKAEASDLVMRLCASAHIGVTDPDRNVLLRIHFGKQVEHNLDKDWTFTLHGAECRFTNSQTNRELEVIMIHSSNFGIIDLHFFLKYLNQELARVDKDTLADIDPNDVENQLRQLYDQGLLTKVDVALQDFNRNISV